MRFHSRSEIYHLRERTFVICFGFYLEIIVNAQMTVFLRSERKVRAENGAGRLGRNNTPSNLVFHVDGQQSDG